MEIAQWHFDTSWILVSSITTQFCGHELHSSCIYYHSGARIYSKFLASSWNMGFPASKNKIMLFPAVTHHPTMHKIYSLYCWCLYGGREGGRDSAPNMLHPAYERLSITRGFMFVKKNISHRSQEQKPYFLFEKRGKIQMLIGTSCLQWNWFPKAQ